MGADEASADEALFDEALTDPVDCAAEEDPVELGLLSLDPPTDILFWSSMMTTICSWAPELLWTWRVRYRLLLFPPRLSETCVTIKIIVF